MKSFGWFEDKHFVFIAMEYIANGDLERYLQHKPALDEFDARQVMFQIVEGLDFMHENGFSHRDLKPAVRSSAREVLILLSCCLECLD